MTTMKNLNVTVTEEVDAKLEKVMEEKHFKNRADAIDWIINEVFELVFKKECA